MYREETVRNRIMNHTSSIKDVEISILDSFDSVFLQFIDWVALNVSVLLLPVRLKSQVQELVAEYDGCTRDSGKYHLSPGN